MKVNPKIDLAFKKLFGSEENTDILLSLINAILPAHEQISELIILNPYNVADYLKGKLSFLHTRAQDKNDCQYDIEIQLRGYDFHRKRTLFYQTEMFGNQLNYSSINEDEENKDKIIKNKLSKFSNYSKIRKRIVISLIDFNFFEDERYYRYFMLKDATTSEMNDDLDYINLYFIELKKFKGKLEPTRTVLERWIIFLNYGYRYGNLPLELATVEEIKKASLKVETMHLNEKEQIGYISQEKYYLDGQSILAEEERKLEEMEKGIQKGKRQTELKVSKRLKKLGISIEDISKATGLSKEEIEKL